MENKNLPFNLQFFADDNITDDPDNNEPDTGQENNYISQEQMMRIASREKKDGKRQGRNSLLKELGVTSVEQARKIIESYTKLAGAFGSNGQQEQQNANMGQQNQGNDLLQRMSEMEQRAQAAEMKLEALKLGVLPDSVDDLCAIALMKSQQDNLEVVNVMENMKKDKKYSGFFTTQQTTENNEEKNTAGTGGTTAGTGTGRIAGTGGSRAGGETESIGKRLGKKRAESGKKQGFYFK